MLRYIARRVLEAIPTILLVTAISFSIMHLDPGGVGAFYSQDLQLTMTPEERARFRHIYGLDRPVHIQYLSWLANLARGDFGHSFRYGEPVNAMLLRTLPATGLLMTTAILLALVISVPVGVVSAVKRGGFLDYLVTVLATFGVSVPTFWFGLMAILVLGLWLQLFPTGGMATPFAPFSLSDRIHHLILPAFVQALPLIGAWSRFVRSSLLDVLAEDYVRTARAKGLSEWTVLFRHALRNALIPLITLLGITIARVISNSAVVEFIFSWPGLGQKYVFAAAQDRDLPVLMAALLMASILTIVGNLLADVGYAFIDPRIRYDTQKGQ